MADVVIVYWRDIPAQVIVRERRTAARRELPKRFIEAIDRTAMRENLAGTDAYLEQWRRAEPVPCGTDLETEADAALASLEAAYPPALLKALVEAGGWMRKPPSSGAD